MKPEALLIGTAIGYLIYRAYNASDLKPIIYKMPYIDNSSKIAISDDMMVEVDLEVSGFIKSFYKPEDIQRRVLPAVIEAGKTLCAFAPVLLGTSPRINVRNTHLGFKILIAWPAKWTTDKAGNIRPPVRDCLLEGFLATNTGRQIKNRIKLFRVYRV